MHRWQSSFVHSAAAVLFFLAALNLLAASCPANALNWLDSVLPLSNRWVLWLAGGAELALSAFLLVGKDIRAKLFWLAWLATNLAVYRAGLWQAGASCLGDCLGNYLEWFLVKPRTMAVVIELLIGFLLIGSYGLLIANWLAGKRISKTELPAAVPPPA